MPSYRISIWHRLKFLQAGSLTGCISTADSVLARPESRDKRGRLAPGRFDTTALIDDGTGDPNQLKGLIY